MAAICGNDTFDDGMRSEPYGTPCDVSLGFFCGRCFVPMRELSIFFFFFFCATENNIADSQHRIQLNSCRFWS